MATPFDPYHRWMGIPPAEQPPNHYRLLGVTLFEDNPDVIESAADQRMVHLRTFQTGQHARESQKLLNAVSMAKLSLLQPVKKLQYDAQLRAKLAQNAAARSAADAVAPTATSPLPQAVALASAAATASSQTAASDWQTDALDFSASAIRRQAPTKPKKPGVPTGLIIGGVAAGVLVLGGIVFALSRSSNDGSNGTPPSNQTAAQTIPAAQAVSPAQASARDDKRNSSPLDSGQSRPREPQVASLNPKNPVPSADSSSPNQVRPSSPPAVGPKKVGDESADSMAATDGISAADLARRRRMQMSADDGTTQPFTAAEIATAPIKPRVIPSAPAKPRDPSRPAAPAVVNNKPQTVTTEPPKKVAVSAPQVRVAVPDDAAQQKALQQLKDVLKEDFANLKGPETQLALAQKLQKMAMETTNDPASQFTMFRQALDLAIKCCDVGLTTSLMEALVASYEVDPSELRQKTFTQLARTAKTPDDRAAIAKTALDQAEQAMKDGHPDATVALCTTATNLAAAVKDTALRDQAKELGERAKRFQKDQVAYDDATKRLKTAPDDADANLVVGRVKCFLLEDWNDGPAYLAKGSDETLKAVAKLETAAPTDAAQQATLADGWWDNAERLKRSERKDDPILKSMHNRAMSWYRLAAPNLSGLVAAKVQKRIDAEDAARPNAPVVEVAYLDDMLEQNLAQVNLTLGKHGAAGYPIYYYLVDGVRQYVSYGPPAQGSIPANRVALGGQLAKHALSLQPRPSGNATVAYQLDGKYRLFEGVAAIMDGGSEPTAVKFRVYADNKPIWESRVLYRSGDAQQFKLRIAKVNMLQLEIVCPGANAGALTTWVNPAVGK